MLALQERGVGHLADRTGGSILALVEASGADDPVRTGQAFLADGRACLEADDARLRAGVRWRLKTEDTIMFARLTQTLFADAHLQGEDIRGQLG